MDIMIDPERNEVAAFLEFAGNLEDLRVLEIGAGYGRLTWRYASNAGTVVGIDPNPERIARANKDMSKDLRGRVALLETTLENYQHEGPPFDVTLMSWAL
jgi:ubiquinone/menaquinone biosynthesis C-methylase UbiE